MKINLKKTAVEAIGGSIGRKWGVEGATSFTKDLDTATVKISHRPAAIAALRWTEAHELGHVETGHDMADAYGLDAYDILFGGDRWVLEVEAWMRATDGALTNRTQVEFMLDCLNSYRRGLPDVSDERWNEMVELVASNAIEPDHARTYVPIEPDPNEELPECMSFKPDDSEDEDGGDQPDRQPQSGGEPETHDQTPDTGWLTQPIIDAVKTGASIADLARLHGLDPNRLPALIKAMVN